jgi:hypothetical protein
MEGGSHEDAAHDIELRKAQHHAHAGSPAADAGGGDADAGARPARRLEDTRTMSMTSAVSKQSQNSVSVRVSRCTSLRIVCARSVCQP